jgi:SET domain-containing protein
MNYLCAASHKPKISLIKLRKVSCEMIDEEDSRCYLSPKIEVQNTANRGKGLLATEPIQKGELVLIVGGDIISSEQLANLDHTYSIQVEENLYIAPIGIQKAYHINHSCEPTAAPIGQITFFALRDIAVGEEICYDYAMTDGTPYDEFECFCGSQHCRGKVTGTDWKIPELWERYAGHFSPYLQRRIDLLKTQVQAVMEYH